VENVVTRHRNLVLLAAMLFAQVIGLAVQVKRPSDHGSTALIRVWAVRLITPLEKAVIHSGSAASGAWRNYLYLRGVRKQNRDLQQEIQQLRLERVRLSEDAGQARRLQALLGFREQFISETTPAQVISTTGTDFSRGIFIDKGTKDGLRVDMPVITPDGVIGKIVRAYPSSSLVLLINDPTSGAGVILEKSRLQGILKGTSDGDTVLNNIMSDEKVIPGDMVLTSGGDRVYPKGLPVGTIVGTGPGKDLFLNVKVKPSARLERLEEVLVITKVEERAPSADDLGVPIRAADILAQRLPSVPAKPEPKPGEAAASTLPQATRNLPPPTRNLPSPAANLPAAPVTAVPSGSAPGKSASGNSVPGKKPPVSAGGVNAVPASDSAAKDNPRAKDNPQ
jgi:rod shape-determining protein MreC